MKDFRGVSKNTYVWVYNSLLEIYYCNLSPLVATYTPNSFLRCPTTFKLDIFVIHLSYVVNLVHRGHGMGRLIHFLRRYSIDSVKLQRNIIYLCTPVTIKITQRLQCQYVTLKLVLQSTYGFTRLEIGLFRDI